MDANTLILGIEWYIVFLFSTVCHEAAHALAAMKLGDRTAYYGGQVSLDPIPHIRREPVGMVAVPLLVYFLTGGSWMMGWASAPYDPFWAQRYPRRAALMALAGPMANLALVLVAALLIHIGMLAGMLEPGRFSFTEIAAPTGDGMAVGLAALVSILFALNLLLCIFNLIPLPPLDGSSILPLFMSPGMADRYRQFLHSPGISLIGLVVAWQVFPHVFRPIFQFAVRLLYGIF